MQDARSGTSDDPELGAFLSEVTQLASRPHAAGAEQFLESIVTLGGRFAQLRRFRTVAALRQRLTRFAAHRFELVDEGREYQQAGNEVLVLSMVLMNHPELSVAVLKEAIQRSSHVLTEAGVATVFGKLLKRLQGLARSTDDADLQRWVRDMTAGLP